MIASGSEYKQALLKLVQSGELANVEGLRILGFQYRSREHTVTPAQLMYFLDTSSLEEAMEHYEAMAMCIAKALGHTSVKRFNVHLLWSFIISSAHDSLNAEPLDLNTMTLTLWPPLVDALRSLHWFDTH